VTNFNDVGNFMIAFGQEVKSKPEFPNSDIVKLRVDLIDEELRELQEACETKDMVEVADALSDLLYVVYGAGHAFGIDLARTFEEVHRSNMSELGEDGKPIYREDGKVLKGPNFKLPNLKKIIDSSL